MEKIKHVIFTRKVQVRVDEADTQRKNDYYKQLRDWSYHANRMANEIMTLRHALRFINEKNKEFEGEHYIPATQFFDSSNHNIGYKLTTKRYKSLLPSNIRASVADRAYKDFQAHIKDVLKGNRSIESYTRNNPVPFGAKAIRKLSLNEEGEATFTFNQIPLSINFGRDKSNNREKVREIIEEECKLCDSSYYFDKHTHKLFFLLTLKQPEKQKNEFIEDKELFLYPGYKDPFLVKINRSTKIIGENHSFVEAKVKLYIQRRKRIKSLRYAAGGRGREKKLAHVHYLTKKERNYVKNVNHIISSDIINTAIENKCGIINFPSINLVNSTDSEIIIKNWAYSELVQLISYKALKEGIALKELEKEKYEEEMKKFKEKLSD